METTEKTTKEQQAATPAQDAQIVNARTKIGAEINSYNLEEETKVRLYDIFLPLLAQVEGWKGKALALVVTDATQLTEMQQAREARLAIREYRLQTERVRVSLKEDSLQKGRAIDGLANLIKGVIAPIESHLQAQEDFAKIAEAKRKEENKVKREQLLQPLGVTVEFFNLADMDEPTFAALLEQSQAAKKAKDEAAQLAIVEAAKKEREAIEAREAQAKENASLKQEAEEREAQYKAEQAARAELERKLEAEREAEKKAQRELAEKMLADKNKAIKEAAEREAALKAEVEAANKAAQAEKSARFNAEFERQQQEAIRLQQEKDRAAKAEAEIADLQRQKESLKAVVNQAVNVAVSAPPPSPHAPIVSSSPKEQLLALAARFENPTLPNFDDFEAERIIASVKAKLVEVSVYIKNQAKNL